MVWVLPVSLLGIYIFPDCVILRLRLNLQECCGRVPWLSLLEDPTPYLRLFPTNLSQVFHLNCCCPGVTAYRLSVLLSKITLCYSKVFNFGVYVLIIFFVIWHVLCWLYMYWVLFCCCIDIIRMNDEQSCVSMGSLELCFL